MPVQTREQHRLQMRRLDACLHVLEDANERDEQVVTPSVLSMLQSDAPGIAVGMTIPRAIQIVLDEQEQCLRTVSSNSIALAPLRGRDIASATAVHNESEQPLDEGAARELTERIRQATRQVCMLLLEAHTRRAWLALGYRTWEQYVQAEFGLSRSRSYQLLDQGRVIGAISSAAGTPEFLDISAYAAEQIKADLAKVVEIVRARAAGRSEAEVRRIVAEVIHIERSALTRGRASREVITQGEPLHTDLSRLYDAVTNLSNMPAATRAADLVAERHAHRLAHLQTALSWLTEFAQAWDRRSHPTGGRMPPTEHPPGGR